MTACSSWQPLLSDAAHGDLKNADQKAAFESHVASCAGCRDELEAQAAFLSTMVLPAKPAAGELDAWREVGPRVFEPRAKRFVLGLPLTATLAFAMLVTGIGIGQLLVTQPDISAMNTATPQLAAGTAAGDPPDDAIASPNAAYVSFLESAAPLLLAITNRQSGTLVSARYPGQTLSRNEPQAAALLASEAGQLADQLSAAKRDREATLVRELELVFLQIANLSHPADDAGLRLLQAAISDRALLFQLSVEELRHLPEPRPEGV